jgi:hypothetical protein
MEKKIIMGAMIFISNDINSFGFPADPKLDPSNGKHDTLPFG